MVSKNGSNNHSGGKEAARRTKSSTAANHRTNNSGTNHQQSGSNQREDEKKYEVGIVEVASNLSDLSGSTGDVDSHNGDDDEDVKQMSTRNADAKEFEILIQAKHAEACKAMGVSQPCL